MLIKCVRVLPDAKIPERASPEAVGYDVYACHVVDKSTREECGQLPITFGPGESVLIGTGLTFAVPPGTDCQVRPRSGLASKHNIELSNSPGTIDPDYRGEAGILLRNRGTEPFTVEKGMRIAQLVFTKVEIPRFVEVEELPQTSRAAGGFGSTGLSEISIGDKEYLAKQRRLDEYFMGIATATSKLSDCLRGAEKTPYGFYKKDADGKYCGATRRFGCVIVSQHNTIITQGFNQRTKECSEEEGCIRERENIPLALPTTLVAYMPRKLLSRTMDALADHL